MSNRVKPSVRVVEVGATFLAAVLLYIALPLVWEPIPLLVRELLLVLSAVIGVHLLERAWLWRDIANWNRESLEDVLRASVALVKSAEACSLTDIYTSREEVRQEVTNAIMKARARVWLLGVELSESVRLGELLHTLRNQVSARVDVRILLLDALRSPAVFRAFLESSSDEAKRIIEVDRTQPPPEDPYFRQRLYNDFAFNYNILTGSATVGARVRLYAHDPICWLVVVDDVTFFQPYTFGRIADLPPENLCIGAYMPVFKFRRQPGAPAFEILEDHFWKLWLTSDVDLFHAGARIADRDRIVRDLFNLRLDWLRHVWESLYGPRNESVSRDDRREFPRQACASSPPSLALCWEENGTAHRVPATVRDCSRRGMSVTVATPPEPREQQVVRLEGGQSAVSLAARFMIERLLEQSGNSFTVKWVKNIQNKTELMVGLEAILRQV